MYHIFCPSPVQEQAVETLYTSSYSVIERRAIQAKAAYLRVMLNPPRPSWVELETNDTAFGKTMKERVEVSWNDLGPVSREQIERTARANNEIVLKSMSWTDIEPFIGYVLERDFAGKHSAKNEEFHEARERWLDAIGMRPDIETKSNLNLMWAAKSIFEKEHFIGIAKVARKSVDEEFEAKRLKKHSESRPLAVQAARTAPYRAAVERNLAEIKAAMRRAALIGVTKTRVANRTVFERYVTEKKATEFLATKRAAEQLAASSVSASSPPNSSPPASSPVSSKNKTKKAKRGKH
ncbi:hypothetical protein EG329_011525 [Mollisiaceae sp. DMI_Dod_QoI]|nr:hypothetical protein EG329_011525 [Helotiales sp. DMI_Dod_QoI]